MFAGTSTGTLEQATLSCCCKVLVSKWAQFSRIYHVTYWGGGVSVCRYVLSICVKYDTMQVNYADHYRWIYLGLQERKKVEHLQKSFLLHIHQWWLMPFWLGRAAIFHLAVSLTIRLIQQLFRKVCHYICAECHCLPIEKYKLYSAHLWERASM